MLSSSMLRPPIRGLALGLALAPAAALAAALTVELRGPEETGLGTVTLTESAHGVLLRAELAGIPPGGHGFHIHETGACAPDFDAAGDHYNPAGRAHGLLNPAGHHAGDMPNVYAGADGTVRAEVLNRAVTLGSGPHSVFDADGSALIVHADPDTHGEEAGAGARIACGVIER